MKKFKHILCCISLFSLIINELHAQQPTADNDNKLLRSKKGELFLPEKGDWALSIDAVPFLGYVGKLFSDSGSGAPAINSLAGYPLTIGGKYFITEKQAYRVRVRVGMLSNTTTNSVIDNENTNIDTVYLKDSKKTSATNVTIAFGKEYRRGRTRLQGFYGYEGILGISTGKTTYAYGNAFTNLNTTPTTSDFNSPTTNGFTSAPSTSRLQADYNGTGVKVSARGFCGAEYFIFPKMSLGIEFGFGIMYYNLNDGKVATESWDAAAGGVRNKTLAKSGYKSFGIDTDNSGGALMLNFHF